MLCHKHRVQQRVAGHSNFIEGFSVSGSDSLEVQTSLSFTPSKNAFNLDIRNEIFSITKMNQIQKSFCNCYPPPQKNEL